jgi:abortive infection bacteriophage resistance protein
VGFFCLKENMEYQKPPLTYSKQLDLLLSRGLQVENKAEALRCLKNKEYGWLIAMS